ncbi:MAG: hypothetical protein ITD42_05745 [Nitrosospira sp.]|nr:hypothetical protein [Nitrosospira sp.]MDW7642973.1 hypothetical protein [Nitrosomonadaceae bacterium]MBI0407796.1 hypothetical protein [Nitrosospira sp.]MBI0415044.1 hypothetical protein [Nitrosospira sp.]MBI0416625.1 hypothetical protein [Nitrosospira sp.]
MTGQAALENIAAESCHSTSEILIQNGLSVLNDLRSCGTLLGIYVEDVSKI